MVFLYYKRFRGGLVLTDIILLTELLRGESCLRVSICQLKKTACEKVFEQFYTKVFTNTFKGI